MTFCGNMTIKSDYWPFNMSPLFNDIYLSLEIIESVIVNMYSVIILKCVNKVELFMSTCLTSLKYSSLLTIAKALPYRSCLPMMIWLQLLRRHCRRCFPSLVATINRRKLQIIISKHLINKFQLFWRKYYISMIS